MLKFTPKFPPRATFRFDQLKELWKADDDDLERAIIAGLLRPCIDVGDELLTIPQWGPDRLESRMVPSGRKKYIERTRRADAPPIAPPRRAAETWTEVVQVSASDYTETETDKDFPEAPLAPLYLRLPHDRPPHGCTFTVGCVDRDADPPETPFEEPDADWYYLPATMTMADVKEKCFFPVREVLRYEEESQAGGSPSDKPLTGKERTTLLNLIGGLLEVVCEQRQDAQESNVQEFADRLASEMAARLGQYPGMTPRTIKAKFKEATDNLKFD